MAKMRRNKRKNNNNETPQNSMPSGRWSFGNIINWSPYYNWEVYQKLCNGNFTPFVGAGLSADIGVGDWNQLLSSLANKVFSTQNRVTKVNVDAPVSQLEKDDCILIDKFYSALLKIDEKDELERDSIKSHVEERIRVLQQFIRESNAAKRPADVQIKFFQQLLNDQRLYSSYEIGELLKCLCGKDEKLYDFLRMVVFEKKKSDHWNIGKEHAVYWLARILKSVHKKGDKFETEE